MTDAGKREAARQFVNKWRGKGNEDEDGRSYWIDLLHNVLGMENVTDRVDFGLASINSTNKNERSRQP